MGRKEAFEDVYATGSATSPSCRRHRWETLGVINAHHVEVPSMARCKSAVSQDHILRNPDGMKTSRQDCIRRNGWH
jgi:hypothetical protein